MRRRVLSGGLVLGLAACSNNGTSTEPIKVATLMVAPDSIRIVRGDSVRLTATPLDANGHLVSGIAITFASADSSVIIVANTGMVRTGGSLGNTKITVSGGGVSQDVPATVFAVATTIDLTPVDTTIRQGGSFTLHAIVYDGSHTPLPGAPVTFASMNLSIATVSPTGTVTGVGSGTVGLSASSGPAQTQVSLTVRDSSLVARTLLDGSPFGVATNRNGTAYVLRHTANVVTRFNLPDTSVVTTFGIADNPTFVTFDTSGATAFVTAQFADRLEIVTLASNTVTDSIAVTGDPFIVRVSPDNQTLWVSTNVDSLYQIDRGSKAVLARYGFAGPNNGLAFSPVNDSLLYTSTLFGGTVVEINYKRKTIGRTFSPGGTTQAVVVSPDGTELYVANEGTGEIEIFNLTTGNALPPISTGGGAFDLELSPDGSSLWTSLSSNGEVRAFNRVTRAQTRRIVTGGVPRRIAFAQSTNLVVVPNEVGWVDFIH